MKDYTPLEKESFFTGMYCKGRQVNNASTRTKNNLTLLSNEEPKSNHFRDARNEVYVYTYTKLNVPVCFSGEMSLAFSRI